MHPILICEIVTETAVCSANCLRSGQRRHSISWKATMRQQNNSVGGQHSRKNVMKWEVSRKLSGRRVVGKQFNEKSVIMRYEDWTGALIVISLEEINIFRIKVEFLNHGYLNCIPFRIRTNFFDSTSFIWLEQQPEMGIIIYPQKHRWVQTYRIIWTSSPSHLHLEIDKREEDIAS